MTAGGIELDGALLALLERRSGRTGLRYRHAPEALRGGYWAEIYAFELDDPPREFAGPLVLRLMPNESRARGEIAVHSAAAELGYGTPRVRASGAAGDGLGQAFIVMDRIDGGTIASGLPLGARLAALPHVPAFLANALVTLHALPSAALIARIEAHGVPAASLGIAARLTELERDIDALAATDLAGALEVLRASRPAASDTVLCHGDLHAFNLILRAGRVEAVIDWTNARLAEPEFDVAYSALLLDQLPLDVPRIVRPWLLRAGRRASRRLVASYRTRRPLDPEKLAWYDALHALVGLVRVELARSNLPGSTPLADSHPWVRMAPANAARLFAFASRARRA